MVNITQRKCLIILTRSASSMNMYEKVNHHVSYALMASTFYTTDTYSNKTIYIRFFYTPLNGNLRTQGL